MKGSKKGLFANTLQQTFVNLFEPGSAPSPAKKTQKSAGSEASASSTQQKRASTPPPFEARQSKWLLNALNAGMSAFGEVVESRFEDVEARALKLEQDLSVEQQKVQSLAATKEEQDRKIADLAKRVEALEVAPASAPGATAAAAGAVAPTSKRIAYVGNLGWDTLAEELELRCRNLLAESGMQVDDLKFLPQVNNQKKGSGCLVMFVCADDVEEARFKVSVIKKSFVAGKTAWLTQHRSRADRAPGLIVAKLATLCSPIVSAAGAGEAVANRSEKTVKCGEDLLAYLEGNTVQWTEEAEKHLTADQRRRFRGLAEAIVA